MRTPLEVLKVINGVAELAFAHLEKFLMKPDDYSLTAVNGYLDTLIKCRDLSGGATELVVVNAAAQAAMLMGKSADA